ncbi:MAG: NTP transferase domain-containing protein [Polyangiales bacterium]
MSDKAIILAAGRGERLVKGFEFPKPLKRVAGLPLITRVLHSLESVGVREVGIVVGHLGETLIRGLRRYDFDLKLHFFWNDEVDKPNGTSLLKASDFVTGPTYLLMSDHLWSPSLFRAVRSVPVHAGESVLGVDYDIDRCFDLDDATKVQTRGERIVAISKTLPHYDALDTGVFRIDPAFIAQLERLNGPAGCSLSQGVAALAQTGRMRVADVGEARWIDVDTPAAHAAAEHLLQQYGPDLQPAAAQIASCAFGM